MDAFILTLTVLVPGALTLFAAYRVVRDPNQGTFDVNVYLVEPYGSWEHVASFDVSIGELELSHYPASTNSHSAGDSVAAEPNTIYKWAEGPFSDTLSDPNAWPSTVSYTGRSDGIGRLTLRTLDAQALIVRLNNIADVNRVYPVVKGQRR